MHRLKIPLILTFLTATTTYATQPEQDWVPERKSSLTQAQLQEADGFSTSAELELDGQCEGVGPEVLELEGVDQMLLGRLGDAEPDISEIGNWGWISQSAELTLAAISNDKEKKPKPTLEKEIVSPYDTLLITAEEKVIIGRLLMTLAEDNVFKLLMERKRLERWGEQIGHVHPVRFLGTVFTDPRLTYCMREIKRSSFKWDGFVDGFAERMQEEAEKNNLVKYVQGFAAAVNRDPEGLYPYFEKADFEGLVKYLLKN